MTDATLLYPVFALIALAVVLHAMMGRARVGSLKRGEVKIQDIALGQPNWTARATQIANAYHNQLQLPVLFYVLVAFILITRANDIFFVALAWVFVLFRYLHAYIHTTSNDLNKRFPAFAAGAAVLLTMWILFAVKTIFGVGF
ncbi:MAG: MAPEG family protein [Hyphomicrobium sp.]|nr:MAPEG family protein [Hyphomicrobium sp.]